MKPSAVWRTFLLIGCVLAGPAVMAQEDELFAAWDQYDSGKYRQAKLAFERAFEAGLEGDGEVHVSYAHSCIMVGAYDEGEKSLREWLSQEPDHAGSLRLLGQVLLTRGQHEEARGIYSRRLKEDPEDLQAIWGLARTHLERGQHEEAHEICRRAVELVQREIIEEPEPLTALAHVFAYLERFERYGNALEEASKALVEALSIDESYVPARLLLGELHVRTYRGVDAMRQFNMALRISPDLAEAHLGIARARDYRGEAGEAERSLRRALGINPSCVPALELQASYRLTDSRMKEARELIDRALEINPRSRSARGLLAAYHFLLGDEEAYEAELARVLEIDPTFGGVFYQIGEQLNNRRRFEEAIPFYRRAIEVEPTLWAAYNSLGRNLTQNNAREEGIEYLKKARQRDGFNYPWRDNMILVLRKLASYSAVSDPPFVFHMPVEERGVLFDYLRELYHEAWETLCAKYQFEPEGPIAVEMFPRSEDFSVRTLGMTGFSALGACFGKLITLVSPRSQLRGQFDWVSTSWHEFTHVITLQMSDGRVPRWLTEGLSVYEEFQRNPKWDREMDFELFNAYHNGEIFPIDELNTAFRTSKILFGYYQGGLISDFIEREWGFDKIIEMLKLYAKDMQTPEIFEQVLGIPTDEFDRRFLVDVEKRIASIQVEPVWSEDAMTGFRRKLQDEPLHLDSLLGLASGYLARGNLVDAERFVGRALEAHPESGRGWLIRGRLALRERSERARDYIEKGLELGAEDAFVRLRYAALLQQAGELEAAIEQYEAAKKAFPRYVGPDCAYRMLYQIHLMRDEKEAAYRQIEELTNISETDLEGRQRLAERAVEEEDWEDAEIYLEEIIGIDPFLPEPHEQLARVFRERGEYALAARELEVWLAIPPQLAQPARAEEPVEAVDLRSRADVFGELAELYLMMGNEAKARAFADQALELEAEQERAREVLDRIGD